MEWINIKDFSFKNTFEINRLYFLYDNEAKLTSKSPSGEVTTLQISPEVAMYKGGGKFIDNNLDILLIEDFTHICPFELPRDGVVENFVHEPTKEPQAEALNKHNVMESLRPTDDEIGAKVEEYGFRVPYDSSNKFYDDEAIKHFRAGAEWARGFGRNAP